MLKQTHCVILCVEYCYNPYTRASSPFGAPCTCPTARHEAFAVLGHEVDDFARKGNPLALSSMVIAFRAPLR